MNPGPHGPESRDLSSKSVDFCGFSSILLLSTALLVQIGVNFQPNYYMKYYRTLLARAAPAQSHTAVALGLPRVGNPNATTMAAPALR